MWTVTNPTGRLIVASWDAMPDVREAYAYHRAVIEHVTKVKQPVICSDWSRANVMAPDVATEMLSMLSASNSHVLRVALLLAPGHATFNLQAERLVRDAKNASRRTFRDRALLLNWLGEVLTPTEQQVAADHLNDKDTNHARSGAH